MKPRTIAVIPARLASTRLARKMLLEIDGKSIVQRTYERVIQCKLVDEIVIATDSPEILDHANSFIQQTIPSSVAITSPEHQSGTDRIAELAARNPDWQLVVNVQGDEPFMGPADIDSAIEAFIHDPLLMMSSLYFNLYDYAEVLNPSVVKVVTDLNDMALYFSRSPIPHLRGMTDSEIQSELDHLQRDKKPSLYKKHLGLYVYRRQTLLQFSKLKQTPLELQEKLEQLRMLQNGVSIKMILAHENSIGIDTQEDLDKAKALI